MDWIKNIEIKKKKKCICTLAKVETFEQFVFGFFFRIRDVLRVTAVVLPSVILLVIFAFTDKKPSRRKFMRFLVIKFYLVNGIAFRLFGKEQIVCFAFGHGIDRLGTVQQNTTYSSNSLINPEHSEIVRTSSGYLKKMSLKNVFLFERRNNRLSPNATVF